MKNKISIYLFIIIIALTACNTAKKFQLDAEYYTVQNRGLFEIDSYDIIQEKETSKSSFAVYVFLAGCSSCAKFKPYLEEYLNENNLMFYSLSITMIKKSKNAISNKIEYAPSVVLFKNGKLVSYLNATKDSHSKYYQSKDGFGSWFTKYVTIN